MMDENVDVKQFGELTQEVQIERAVGIGFYLGSWAQLSPSLF